MTRSNRVTLLLAMSISMNVAVLGAAGVHWLRDGGTARRTIEGAKSALLALDLSSKQEARFHELRADLHTFRDSCHERMMGLRKQLLAALMTEPPDRDRIAEVMEKIVARQAHLQQRIVDHLLAEKAVLRPEQLPAFNTVLRRHVLGPRVGAPGCLGADLHGAP